VPGGGIGPDGGRWISCRKQSFFLPVRVLGCRFRNLFLIYLRKAFREGKLRFHGELAGLARPAVFEAVCHKAGKIKWVVYAKAPFGGPEQVLKYLARYTHRVAISNRRLLSIRDGRVIFEWKDYARGCKTGTMTLDAVEFIRRFLLHILPGGFVRIRQYGFLANRARKKKLQLCQALLGTLSAATIDRGKQSEERTRKQCPVCKTGHMILIAAVQLKVSLPPHQRSP
jgi:hypothetical protein